MKTKIIYISGNEVFDMADIRVAFDTVRAALSLGPDTVLFGVPVDSDDAFCNTTVTDVIQPITSDKEIKTDTVGHIDETQIVIDATSEKPKKTTRTTRAKVVPIASAAKDSEPTTDPEQATETAVPILSVLGTKSDTPTPDETVDTTPINVTPIDISAVTDEKSLNETETGLESQPVSINDMLADETAPIEPREKTLEELLESMTPLGEDEKNITEPIDHVIPETDTTEIATPNDDTDATLELLAAEFAENEDKIVAPAKTETRGKIGKLKNILPFKKAKRDDSGIMGDLFGWAGVANDEDFTIPGFFANASSKK